MLHRHFNANKTRRKNTLSSILLKYFKMLDRRKYLSRNNRVRRNHSITMDYFEKRQRLLLVRIYSEVDSREWISFWKIEYFLKRIKNTGVAQRLEQRSYKP